MSWKSLLLGLVRSTPPPHRHAWREYQDVRLQYRKGDCRELVTVDVARVRRCEGCGQVEVLKW